MVRMTARQARKLGLLPPTGKKGAPRLPNGDARRALKGERKRVRIETFVTTPMPSLANMRLHWQAKHRTAKEQRRAAWDAVAFELIRRNIDLQRIAGASVMMTRCSPRKLGSDNLQMALKSIRDGIADAIGVDDEDEYPERPDGFWQWMCRQQASETQGVAVGMSLLVTEGE